MGCGHPGVQITSQCSGRVRVASIACSHPMSLGASRDPPDIVIRHAAAPPKVTGDPMADKNVWFVTGAGRGMGVDIVKAALAAGHRVVATGRNPNAVAEAIGA